MASDLIERLKKCALGSADEDVMVRWDKIRAILKQDKGGTWPRDCFESIIDGYAEDCEDAVKEIASLRTALAIERERAEKAEKDAARARDYLESAAQQWRTAEASLAEARALLKVFADVAEQDIDEIEKDADRFVPMRTYNKAPLLTVGDLRAAARFLEDIDNGR